MYILTAFIVKSAVITLSRADVKLDFPEVLYNPEQKQVKFW
jgi:hypothetical protein